MSKQIRVVRFVPPHLATSDNHPHREECIYSEEEICAQGFLACMVDDEHSITVSYVPSKSS